MQYDKFVALVQKRGQLPSRGAAVRAIHATLQTLGERLFHGEEEQLASQLTPEIGYFLLQVKDKEKLDMDDFFDSIAAYEGISRSNAMQHARVVLSVLADAVSPGAVNHVRAQLPRDLKWLLEFDLDQSQTQSRAVPLSR